MIIRQTPLSDLPTILAEHYRPRGEKALDDGDWRWKEGTFFNCDLRYFPLSCLGGNFDVVLMDPPWRLRGSEQISPEMTMFSNSNYIFSLNFR
jgi:hypothetical protein